MPKLIAIDLDGTLFYPKKRIRLVSKANQAFIKHAIAKGHQIVFVTSRNRKFVEKVLKELAIDIDFICRNGSMVIHQKKVILNQTVAPEAIEKVVSYIQKRHDKYMFSIDTDQESNLVYTSKYVWYLDALYRFYYLLQGRYREKYRKDNDYFMATLKRKGVNIYRQLIYFGIGKKAGLLALKESKALKKAFPELEIAWIHSLIEVASLGTNKANALHALIKAKGVNPDDVWVIGDSGNDVPMFDAFKHSYCMAHAHPEVKKHAKHIIERVHHLRDQL
jgi:hypothetical protein